MSDALMKTAAGETTQVGRSIPRLPVTPEAVYRAIRASNNDTLGDD